MSILEKQASQLGQQASQECERLAKDKAVTLQMLQKVIKKTSYFLQFRCESTYVIFQEKERLSALERRYHSLTGGKSFPKSSTSMREVSRLLNLIQTHSSFSCLQLKSQYSSDNPQLCAVILTCLVIYICLHLTDQRSVAGMLCFTEDL